MTTIRDDAMDHGFQAGFIKDPWGRQGRKWDLARCGQNCACGPGCDFCPANLLSEKHNLGRSRFLPGNVLLPLSWQYSTMVFVCPQGDLFHNDISRSDIAKVFAVADACPDHCFLFLTKRARRMARILSDPKFMHDVWVEGSTIFGDFSVSAEWGANCLIGVSVEDQPRMVRAEALMDLPGCFRKVLFAAPLLGRLNIETVAQGLSWVVCNRERGSAYTKPRPCRDEWIVSLHDQCQEAVVPFFLQDRFSVKMLSELGPKSFRQYPDIPFFQQAQ